MGRANQLIDEGFKGSSKRKVEKTVSLIKRGTGRSGEDVFDEEPQRIEGYIKNKYLQEIINRRTSQKAVSSLRNDSTKSPLGDSDFRNLLNNVGLAGRERFADYLLNKYLTSRIQAIERSKVTTLSGKTREGLKINNRVYIIGVTGVNGKKYLQARSFKTGRVVKLPKSVKKLKA